MAADIKQWSKCFLGLMIFGAIVWGEADEMRYRPEWAQWLALALWAGIASVILSIAFIEAHKAS